MHKAVKLCFLPLFFSISGCASLLDDEDARPALTPLEIQSIQKRNLETTGDIAFASVVSVFQDLGYTIVSADKETGFITAKSLAETREEEDYVDIFLDTLLDIEEDYGLLTVQTNATAFVEPFSESRTSVRLSFVKSKIRSSDKGQNSTKDKQILDVEIYRNAFERIENAVFIRTAGGV